MAEDPIVCPKCGRAHAPSERFCEACGMPLVHTTHGAEIEASELQRKARKIKPQYANGPLVKVANARGQPEAEFIAGLLLEEGIPCLLRNSMAGYSSTINRCDVMVPESGADAARDALKWERPA